MKKEYKTGEKKNCMSVMKHDKFDRFHVINSIFNIFGLL